MTTVTGFTASKMQEIEDKTINNAQLSGDDLILIQRDLTQINVGSVRGPQGVPGNDGTDGAQGPAGPIDLVGQPHIVTTPHSSFSSNSYIDLQRNNVSLISGNRYGVVLHLPIIIFSSFQSASHVNIHLHVDSTDAGRFGGFKPGTTGETRWNMHSEELWIAPSTDLFDFAVYFDFRPGSVVQIDIPGTSVLPRWLNIIDYGPVV